MIPSLGPSLFLALAACCAAGAVLRWSVDLAVRALVVRRRAGTTAPPEWPPTPWGIGLVNLTGALALGLLSGVARRGGAHDVTVALLGTGFLGSFTTFSTFVVDVVRLWTAGRRRAGAGVVVVTVVGGTALAALGYLLTS